MNTKTEREATTPVRILYAKVPTAREEEWKQKVSRYFPMRPVHLYSDDPTSIIVLTIHPVVEI